MKDQIVMSPNNAEICVAIPLYRILETEAVINMGKHKILLTEEKPIAYVLDVGEFNQILSAEWVENNLEFLGEL